MSYPEKPTKTDELAKWTVGSDGRLYVNVVKGEIYSEGLMNKVKTVIAGKLPQADNEDEQESYNAFNHNNETFSISQFDKGFGLQTLLYKGAARYAGKKPLINPFEGQTTLEQQSTGQKTGTSKFGGNNKNWTPKPPAKVVLEDAGQDVKRLVFDEAVADTPKGGPRVMKLNPTGYNESGAEIYLTYIPPTL